MLAIGRSTLRGKMSLAGVQSGGVLSPVLSPRLLQSRRQEGGFRQPTFVHFIGLHSKKVEVAQRAARIITAAQVGSQNLNPSEFPEGKVGAGGGNGAGGSTQSHDLGYGQERRQKFPYGKVGAGGGHGNVNGGSVQTYSLDVGESRKLKFSDLKVGGGGGGGNGGNGNSTQSYNLDVGQERTQNFPDGKVGNGNGNGGSAQIYLDVGQNRRQKFPDGKVGNGNAGSVQSYNLDVGQKRRQGTLSQQAALQVIASAAPQSPPGVYGVYGVESDSSSDLEVIRPDLLQGTQEWLDLRKTRITASSFGNSLGFWGGRRFELWEEKIGIRAPFAGNAATVWGSSAEANAIEKYKEITGNGVDHVAFKIYHAGDEYLSWLGASPDGLITYNNVEGVQDSDEGLGILEVKCPHNKGNPELGTPWDRVPHYYMPQAQGLLEIFDRKQMDFYVWTPNGSCVFRIERNPEYWGLMFRMMSEFWWGHVVPAKCALAKGKSIADVQAVFRPVEDLIATERIVSLSRLLAQNSRLIWMENRGQIQRLL